MIIQRCLFIVDKINYVYFYNVLKINVLIIEELLEMGLSNTTKRMEHTLMISMSPMVH